LIFFNIFLKKRQNGLCANKYFDRVRMVEDGRASPAAPDTRHAAPATHPEKANAVALTMPCHFRLLRSMHINFV
jgi:hypothetical protein